MKLVVAAVVLLVVVAAIAVCMAYIDAMED